MFLAVNAVFEMPTSMFFILGKVVTFCKYRLNCDQTGIKSATTPQRPHKFDAASVPSTTKKYRSVLSYSTGAKVTHLCINIIAVGLPFTPLFMLIV